MVQHLKTHILDMVKNDTFPAVKTEDDAVPREVEQIEYQTDLLQPHLAADETSRRVVGLGGASSLEDMMNNNIRTHFMRRTMADIEEAFRGKDELSEADYEKMLKQTRETLKPLEDAIRLPA